MRILLVCPDCPYPPHDGGSLRIVNLASSLARHASVMLLTYVVSAAEAKALAEFGNKFGIRVHGVQRPARRNTLTRAWHKLCYYHGSYLFTSLPGPVRFNSRPVMHEALPQILQDFVPDVILWEYWFMTGFAETIRTISPSTVQVADAIDLEWLRLERHAQMSRGLTKRWINHIQPRVYRYTLDRYRSMDGIIFLSKADAKLAQRDLPNSDRLRVIPVGLTLDEYPAPTISPKSGRVLFFGSFRHQPNVDALRFLLQDIWPPIQQALPQATLDLMGPDMPEWVRQAAQSFPNIRILGYRPDIRPTLTEASVVIAPLRFGSGVKIKILESMALGKVVVTTPTGAEGIEGRPGIDFLIANDAASFVSETVRLLTDPQRCANLGQHARQFIQTHHDADQVATDFLVELKKLCMNHRPAQ